MNRLLPLLCLLLFCNDFGDETREVRYYATSTEPVLMLRYMDDSGEMVSVSNPTMPFEAIIDIEPGERYLKIEIETDPMGPSSDFYAQIDIEGRDTCHSLDTGFVGIASMRTNDETGYFTCFE